MAKQISTTKLLVTYYWSLIKSPQTFMLTLSGIAGYLSQTHLSINWLILIGLVGSLLITISGCTILNMIVDRDIDRKMVRTSQRPLASGQMETRIALLLGCSLVALGLLWSAILSTLYFTVILTGVGLHVMIYTLWLKRRSPWSILWGGFAGGMPILAGRFLAIGRIDLLGVLLALVIVFWIPSHNLTLNLLHQEDYLNAGVPTFPSTYGVTTTYAMMTISGLLVAGLIMAASKYLGLPVLILAFLFAASLGLVSLDVSVWVNPSPELIAILFKYSTFYMLVTLLLLSIGGSMR